MSAGVAGIAIAVVATAVLSSALTLAAGWWLLSRRLRPRIEAEVERRLAAWLAGAGDRLGAEVQERVRRGVVEGVAEVASAEGLRGTAETLGKSGADLLARSLAGLLKRR